MSNRVAFTPLKSLETTLDPTIQQRARTLFAAAKTKTARGSGNDLDKAIAGNGTAIASACLLLAKIESEGTNIDDFDAHQRHAMVTKAQFKALMATLQSVLDLQSDAKTAFTPSKGSARKRKAAAEEDEAEPVTPTKSGKRDTPDSHRITDLSARNSARRSGRSSALRDGLAVSSEQQRRKEEEMESISSGVSKAGGSRPSRHSVNEPPSSIADTLQVVTPTKAKPRNNTLDTKPSGKSPFELALASHSARSSKLATTDSPAKAGRALGDVLMNPIMNAQAEPKQEVEEPQTEQVPYEPYWGDLHIRFRRREDVAARRKKTEAWRQAMLLRCSAFS